MTAYDPGYVRVLAGQLALAAWPRSELAEDLRWIPDVGEAVRLLERQNAWARWEAKRLWGFGEEAPDKDG